MFASVGLGTTVCVCEPLQVCTFLTSLGAFGLVTSKMRTPAMWSLGSCTPPLPQSLRLPAPSAEMKSKLPTMDGSPCDVMHSTTEASVGLAVSVISQIVKPAKFAWYTKCVPKARSELMKVRPRTVSNCAGFLENDTRRMLLAATPASNRPGLRFVRGSWALG